MHTISRLKREPGFVLQWRLAAFQRWLAMEPPVWGKLRMGPVDFQALALPLVGETTVNLVFDPPWDRPRMSEAAQPTPGLWLPAAQRSFHPQKKRVL